MGNVRDIAGTEEVLAIVANSIREDVGASDITTKLFVPQTAPAEAFIIARESCVVSGSGVAVEVFRAVDPSLNCRILVQDGSSAVAGTRIVQCEGRAGSILTAERTALNFMQRMSGIASLTRAFADRVAGLGVKILDTRKTTPGLRVLEKYAVRCGGGINHRMGLFDSVLVKDNHLELWRKGNHELSDLAEAVEQARTQKPGVIIEIEVDSEKDLPAVLSARPDWILLDNMEPDLLARCVRKCSGHCRTEASGRVTLENVRAIAESGVDAVSIGALTHSARSVDLALDILQVQGECK